MRIKKAKKKLPQASNHLFCYLWITIQGKKSNFLHKNNQIKRRTTYFRPQSGKISSYLNGSNFKILTYLKKLLKSGSQMHFLIDKVAKSSLYYQGMS